MVNDKKLLIKNKKDAKVASTVIQFIQELTCTINKKYIKFSVDGLNVGGNATVGSTVIHFSNKQTLRPRRTPGSNLGGGASLTFFSKRRLDR